MTEINVTEVNVTEVSATPQRRRLVSPSQCDTSKTTSLVKIIGSSTSEQDALSVVQYVQSGNAFTAIPEKEGAPCSAVETKIESFVIPAPSPSIPASLIPSLPPPSSPFSSPSSEQTPPPPPSTQPPFSDESSSSIVIILVSVLSSVCVCCIIAFVCWRRRRRYRDVNTVRENVL